MDTRDGEPPHEGAAERDGLATHLVIEGGDAAADLLDTDVDAVASAAALAERVAVNG